MFLGSMLFERLRFRLGKDGCSASAPSNSVQLGEAPTFHTSIPEAEVEGEARLHAVEGEAAH